jgi:hypothetical protein
MSLSEFLLVDPWLLPCRQPVPALPLQRVA